MTRGNALFIAVGSAVVFFAVALVARADRTESRPTLHEYIEPPSEGPGGIVDPGGTGDNPDLFGDDPAVGQNPSGFRRGDKILPKPDTRTQPNPDQREPVHGRGGFAADRDTESRPDLQTGPDSTLHYVEVFNPSIVPFKRMTTLDAVRAGYVMEIYDRATDELTVGGEQVAGRDMFWGSLAVDLKPGVEVPIPSVAPDMRILSYEIEPRTTVTFSKDGADNYYVRSDESGAGGVYRLVFLADADVRYFAPDVPLGYRVYEIDQRRVRPVPDEVRRVAQRAMRKLGVHRNMEVKDALDNMVTYFRNFEAQDPPSSSGDIFWDLFDSQAGVCRHRSFAFMVVANSLGIPARFVANEAHAWVEVWVPDRDGGLWLRVDLGGAALEMQVYNAKDKTMYRPRGEDTFPQPDKYANNYTQLRGDIDGLTDDQIAEARTPMPDADDPDGDGLPGDTDDPGRPAIGPGQKLPQLPQSEYIGKTTTAIFVQEASSTGFRGESIEIRGRLVDDGELGIAGQRVDLYLAPVQYGGDYATLVGHTVTLGDGSYAAKVAIPRDLDLGDHEVYAATPGDDTYAPALSGE